MKEDDPNLNPKTYGKDILRVLAEARGGLVATDASQQLEAAVRASQEAGKKSTVTIVLTLDPHGKDNREMHVTAKVTSKLPPKPGLDERSIFYASGGQLHRHDPEEQGDLYADGGELGERRRALRPTG